jgi:glyoxylase-like metal-dependent hydrolase (beta-lactamase superfamily II)
VIRVDLGDVQVSVLDAGSLWLDGGAMFGVVPKPLWSRDREVDDANRIELAMNVVLVDDGRTRTLIDTGAGSKWDEKARKIYRLRERSPEEFLAPCGLGPADVDRVVVSHLHFDHAGGNTLRDDDGELHATFPNAEYVVQRGEVEFSRLSNERVRASYLAENIEPLMAEPGRVRAIDGHHAIAPGLEARLAPGHTPHMQVVLVHGERRTLAFLADLVPTAAHVRLPWIMGFDVEPLATLASKKRILPEALRERWLVVFEHDRSVPLGELYEDEGRLRARPVAGD